MTDLPELDLSRLPGHIAIIMDGNGRWAQSRGMPRPLGHKEGVVSVRKIVESATELGIGVLTLYAFSTENWKRPPLEVQALMGLLKTFLQSELDDLVKNNVSLRTIGQTDKLPKEVRKVLLGVCEKTASNDGLILNLALSYGGRDELTRAVRNICKDCADGTLSRQDITEDTISGHLDTAGLPDPDLLIRTGGESRLSNFLLWQLSYAEIYITEILWPDFRKAELYKAIADFQSRQRRFGKTSAQVTS